MRGGEEWRLSVWRSPYAIRTKRSSFPDRDLVQPCHQEVTASRHRGDGQFLTRSHRTALTEQTGPVPRVITRSFLGKEVVLRYPELNLPRGQCDEVGF